MVAGFALLSVLHGRIIEPVPFRRQSRFWTCLVLLAMAVLLGCMGDMHCSGQDACEDECLACVAAFPSLTLVPQTVLARMEPAVAPGVPQAVYADSQVLTPPPRF
jgi:hypothetical protein